MELSEPAPRPGARDFVRALPQTSQVVVGLVSVTLAAACFVRFGLSGRAAVGAAFVVVLVVLSAIDLDCRLIPNVILLPTLALLLAAQIALYPDRTLEWVVASLGAALFLFLPLLVIPTGMGMGDIKLAALLGAVLGRSVVTAILIALLAGGVLSAAVLVREGFGARKKGIAYGPFLALGGVGVLLLGGQ